MRSLSSVLLFPLALGSFGSLAACSSDSREKASVAALSAEDREAMTESSMGGFQLSLVAFAAIQLPTVTCPMITVSGTSATIEGKGCIDDNGTKWDGKLSVSVGSSGVSISLDDFSLVDTEDASSAVTVDGEITSSSGGTSVQSDVTITVPGKELSHEGSWTSLSGSGGVISSGSSVELEGKGYVDTSGQWNLEARSGAIELKGEDTYRVDFTTYVDGCAEATLDGAAAGRVCVEAAFEARPSPLAFFLGKLAGLSRAR